MDVARLVAATNLPAILNAEPLRTPRKRREKRKTSFTAETREKTKRENG
jgi:hypothetical protein